MTENIQDIVKEISRTMGSLIGTRVYIMISDADGNLLSSDSIFETRKNLIKTFIKSNFNYLKIGEHSIPLSSENFIFFRTSDSSVTVLHNPKGRIGQLLQFKTIMNKYCDSLEQCFRDFVPTELEPEAPSPPILEVPVREIILPILSKQEIYYSHIKFSLSKKIDGKQLFSFNEGRILKYAEENKNIFDLIRSETPSEIHPFEILYKLFSKKIIEFKEYELIKTQCPECKNSAYYFIPKYLLEKSRKRVRAQLSPEVCEHTFVAFIDKKLRVKSKKIEKLLDLNDKLELLKLSIENLIAFFGQDLFFNIFHAIFFRFPIIFVGESIEEHIRKIVDFLKRFFPMLAYGNEISCVNEVRYKKEYKRYENHLIIDFNSHISVDPYEEQEYFNFEYNLFKEVFKIEKTNLQVLKVNSEFETLILHTDRILNELASIKEISEDDLIKIMKDKHNLTIKREEIPIIQELAEIYYKTDISKKIIRTVSGQLSSFFDII